MTVQQKPFHYVPRSVKAFLFLSLSFQIFWHHQFPPLRGQIQQLPYPPSIEQLRIFSLGDSVAGAKLLMLWLQSFDNQGGNFLSYRQLNYTTLKAWLEQILLLDPHSQYPLLVASHIYSVTPDSKGVRLMSEFIYEKFFEDPHQRWPWLSQAAILAKHRLKDLPLALKYAQAIAKHSTPNMPFWAREMRIFILEELGELEQARLIVGGLLASGQIEDANEIKFLDGKLHELEAKSTKKNIPIP